MLMDASMEWAMKLIFICKFQLDIKRCYHVMWMCMLTCKKCFLINEISQRAHKNVIKKELTRLFTLVMYADSFLVVLCDIRIIENAK